MRRVALLGLLLAAPAGEASQTETRCGWYHNPTPANHWLDDAHGSWELSVQSRGGAPGFDELPSGSQDFGEDWVEVNGFYGFGCACMDGLFGDPARGEVIRIDALRPLPLDRCRADPELPPVSQ